VLERQLVQIHGQPQGRDAPVERALDDLEFDPGQRLPEALVHTESEGHVPARVAVDVPAGRGRRMPPRPGWRHLGEDHAVAGADELAGDFDVLEGDPASSGVSHIEVL
jgi:hypothetical protein